MKFALVNSSSNPNQSQLISTNELIEIHDEQAFKNCYPLISWGPVHAALHSALYLIDDDKSPTRMYAMYVIDESNASHAKQQLLNNHSYCHFFEVADDDIFMFTRAHFEYDEMQQLIESIKPCSLDCTQNTKNFFELMYEFGFDIKESEKIMHAYQSADALLDTHVDKTLNAFKAFFNNIW